MAEIVSVEQVINSSIIKKGSIVHFAGNASSPQVLLEQLVRDKTIQDIDLICVFPLGEIMKELYGEANKDRFTHRVIFNSPFSREAMNKGWGKYQLMHLSHIPKQIKEYIKPNIVFISVAGPDNGGNYSFGTTIGGIKAGIESVKAQGGIVIAERNKQTPFILGTTIHEKDIDYVVESNYPLPITPISEPDDLSKRIGNIITQLYITDRCTLQYGIGEVPGAVTKAIIEKGVKNLGVFTELFTDSMRLLVDKGIVTNKYRKNQFSEATFFLSSSAKGYQWLHANSAVRIRPCDDTNDIRVIARQPKMIAINSAIGVDLHGNIWADSLEARSIYSGVGGQSDYLRGAQLSDGGIPIIALKSTTKKGLPKIEDMHPKGITLTATATDQIIIVTENGSFNPNGLSIGERAVGIAYLADEEQKAKLLEIIFNDPVFHRPGAALRDEIPKGFTPYKNI